MPPRKTPNLNQPIKKSSWPAFSPVLSIVLVIVVALIIGAGLYYLSTKSKNLDTIPTGLNTANKNANTNNTVTNFTECAAAGYPVMDSYPRRCTANGQTFNEDITNANGNTNANINIVACTMEAKLCPDGSYVSRIPPDCKFAACPTETGLNLNINRDTNTDINDNANTDENENINSISGATGWQTYTSQTNGYSIQYPNDWTISETLGPKTIFISPPDSSSEGTIEVGPELFIESSASIATDLVRNKKTVYINGLTTTQQIESGMVDMVATYFTASDHTYIMVFWPEDFQADYPEYQEILSTFQFNR